MARDDEQLRRYRTRNAVLESNASAGAVVVGTMTLVLTGVKGDPENPIGVVYATPAPATHEPAGTIVIRRRGSARRPSIAGTPQFISRPPRLRRPQRRST
jgi:hypothetical protein